MNSSLLALPVLAQSRNEGDSLGEVSKVIGRDKPRLSAMPPSSSCRYSFRPSRFRYVSATVPRRNRARLSAAI